ncbi:hypothetical protein THAOC_37766, partial [Thalassiosira oceanica]
PVQGPERVVARRRSRSLKSSSLFNASRPSKTRQIWIPFTSRATDGSSLYHKDQWGSGLPLRRAAPVAPPLAQRPVWASWLAWAGAGTGKLAGTSPGRGSACPSASRHRPRLGRGGGRPTNLRYRPPSPEAVVDAADWVPNKWSEAQADRVLPGRGILRLHEMIERLGVRPRGR